MPTTPPSPVTAAATVLGGGRPSRRIRVQWRDPRPPKRTTSSDPILRNRHKALAALRRLRLGFWRSLGRSNYLFPRKLVVTREGKWIIGIALLLGGAAVNTGNNLLYLMLSLAISVIAISGMLSEWCLRDLELLRCYPPELVQGQVTLLRIEVFNDKARAALHLEIGEVLDGATDVQVRAGFVLQLGPREVGQAFAAMRPLRRGPLATSGLQLTTAYPFGFAQKSRLFDEPAYFLALPTVTPTVLNWRGAQDRGASEISRRIGQGDSFAGLRDARPGDAQRDIYWKASARRQRLIVREWQAEANRVAVVRFAHLSPSASSDPATLDAACARVAGICESLLAAQFAVAIQTFAGSVAAQADVLGRGEQLLRIRRHLAWLTLADQPPPPQWPLDDLPWAQAVHQAYQVHQTVTNGDLLPWAPLSLNGAAEIVLVRFASRAQVHGYGAFDTLIELDSAGDILTVAQARQPLAGAA
ncbi:MAG: DUF58 domain-containing protein [Myxococcales bacterium]|nr:DUF58 domain-containing protein [Myxococcales bacterium]